MERQRLEQLRVERENFYAEQQKRAQEQYNLEQARFAEEQRLAEVRRLRQAEEQRLAEIQRQANVPVVINQSPRQVVVYSSREVIYPRQVGTIQPSTRYINQGENLEGPKKKGHSTRNKIIAGAAIAGGTALGIWLSKRN